MVTIFILNTKLVKKGYYINNSNNNLTPYKNNNFALKQKKVVIGNY